MNTALETASFFHISSCLCVYRPDLVMKYIYTQDMTLVDADYTANLTCPTRCSFPRFLALARPCHDAENNHSLAVTVAGTELFCQPQHV